MTMVATSKECAKWPVALCCFVLLAALPLVFCRSVRANTLPQTSFEGQTITGIVFEPAAQPYPTDQLLSLLPIKAGAPFRDRELRSAIQSLFSTGRFVDIAVDATQSGTGVLLRFITKRAYFVGRITVEGVKEPPNHGQLVSDTKLVLGRPFTDPDKQQAIESLRDSLRRNGFYNSIISAGAEYDGDTQEVDLDFQVEAGDRAKFQDPVITGNPQRPQESVVRSTRWQRLWGLLGWQPVTESRVQQGLDNIRRYYQKRE